MKISMSLFTNYIRCSLLNFRMIKVVRYPHMGIAHITSNDWELLLVLSRRGHGNISPSHWVRLDLVDSILTGRIKTNTTDL